MNESEYIELPGYSNKEEFYSHVFRNAGALLQGETDLLANCANISSLLYHTMIDVNWCGFYFLKGEELVLGPYQGKPACTRIALGKGVCGTAAEQHRSIIVEEVSLFPGHISCDGASRSEIVIPMLWDDELLGVLDIDSPISSRFDSTDKKYLERIVHSILMESASTFFEETD